MGAAGAGIATGATQVLSSKMQANALEQQSEWQAQQLEFNAQTSMVQRKEIMDQSERDVNLRNRDVSAMLGMQKASLAASGIDVNSDVSQVLQEDTRRTGREDIIAIKNNAWREAWGLDVKVADINNQKNFALAGGKLNAATTIAGGGLQGISSVMGGIAQQSRDERSLR